MSKKVIAVLTVLSAIFLFYSVNNASAQNIADKIGRPWEVDKDAIVINPGGHTAASSMLPVPEPSSSEAVAVPDRGVLHDESGMIRNNNRRIFSPLMTGRSFMELVNIIIFHDLSSH
jgi:hypothetical protein